MKLSNNSFQQIQDPARLCTNSHRYSKIYIRNIPKSSNLSKNQGLCLDSRPASTSPLRSLTPLSFVSASNVKITLEMQKGLLKHSFQRKSLAQTLKMNTEGVEKNTRAIEKIPLNQHNRVETPKELNLKECTFGKKIGNKENSYVGIHSRQKKVNMKKTKCSLNSLEKPNKIFNGNHNLKLDLDTDELETSYIKISSNLERLSRNIQYVIKNSKCY